MTTMILEWSSIGQTANRLANARRVRMYHLISCERPVDGSAIFHTTTHKILGIAANPLLLLFAEESKGARVPVHLCCTV